MKKQIIIEWIVASAVLILVVPFLMVKLSADGDELFNFFRYHIRLITPVVIVFLIISQVWRHKRLSEKTNKLSK